MEWPQLLHGFGYAAAVLLMFGSGFFCGMLRRAKAAAVSPTIGSVASGELTKQVAAAEAQAREAFETKDKYGGLIERVIAQRDHRWQMFLRHSREHQNAQLVLERAVLETRLLLAKAVKVLNDDRKRHGEPLLELPELQGPDDPPVGTALRFKALMEELKSQMEKNDPPIDAAAEKAEIDVGVA